MVTNNARYTREIKSMIAMLKSAFNKNKTLFIPKCRNKGSAIFRSIALFGAETWRFRKIDQKYF
jgi:hypothetical protein